MEPEYTQILETAKQLSIEKKRDLVFSLFPDFLNQGVNKEVEQHKAEDYETLLRKVLDYGQEEFDKNILYISSSTLGITVAFIEKVVKLDDAHSKVYLWTGWCFLSATILLYVLSHLISAQITQNILDAFREENNNKFEQDKSYKVRLYNFLGKKIINCINYILFIMMASGIIYILLFINKNIKIS